MTLVSRLGQHDLVDTGRTVTCVKIKPVWPPERRRGAGAGRVLPFRLAQQTVGLACDLRQPRGIFANPHLQCGSVRLGLALPSLLFRAMGALVGGACNRFGGLRCLPRAIQRKSPGRGNRGSLLGPPIRGSFGGHGRRSRDSLHVILCFRCDGHHKMYGFSAR